MIFVIRNVNVIIRSSPYMKDKMLLLITWFQDFIEF